VPSVVCTKAETQTFACSKCTVGDHREVDGVQAVTAAAKTWRRLRGENQLPKVVRGVKFHNGIEVVEMPALNAA
jgi:hypothetical protein